MNNFGTTAHDNSCLKAFVSLGQKPDVVKANFNAGFNWVQLLQLIGDFPQYFGAIAAIAAALKSGNVAALTALLAQYGPQLMGLIQAIAAMFGITVPTIPTVP